MPQNKIKIGDKVYINGEFECKVLDILQDDTYVLLEKGAWPLGKIHITKYCTLEPQFQ